MYIYWISYLSYNNLIPNIFDEKLTECIANTSKEAWEFFKQENKEKTKDFVENNTKSKKLTDNISKIKTLHPFIFNINDDDVLFYEKESCNGILFQQYLIMRSKWHIEDVITKEETQKEIYNIIFSLLDKEPTAKKQLSEEKRKIIANFILNGFLDSLKNSYKGKNNA